VKLMQNTKSYLNFIIMDFRRFFKRQIFFIFILLQLMVISCGQKNNSIDVILSEKDKKVDILFDGKLFTSYIFPEDLEKPVLFPVYSSKGTVITRGYPRNPRPGERVDHPHHIGIWFNFGDVNGLDFWNNSYDIPANKKDKYGSIRHKSIIEIKSGSKKGILKVKAEWIDSKQNVLLTEETTFIFSGSENLRRIDRITVLTALNEKVTFNDCKEGLFAIRVDRAFETPINKPEIFTDANGMQTSVPIINNEGVNGIYRNSNGLEKADVWGKQANWVKLSATKEGELISIAVFDNKNNMGYPAHWHARDYGLFAVNNMGSKSYNPGDPEFSYSLEPGQSLTFRYRFDVKSGSAMTDEEMNREFEDFGATNP